MEILKLYKDMISLINSIIKHIQIPNDGVTDGTVNEF